MGNNPSLYFIAFAIVGYSAVYIASAAGLFRRWYEGQLIPTISTVLEVARISDLNSNGTKDHLALTVRLKKEGSTGAVRLESLMVEVFCVNQVTKSPETSVVSAKRKWPLADNRSLDEIGSPVSKRRINAIWTSEEGRTINLAPPESTQFGSYEHINSDGIYEIVVTLVGVRYKRGSEYTRRFEDGTRDALFYTSSTISLPVETRASRALPIYPVNEDVQQRRIA